MEEGARDLLRRFCGGLDADKVPGEDSNEIELELSLGSCFSVKNCEIGGAARPSSISTVISSEFRPVAPLLRACSMPSETEENRRRREMQSIKRMEAKRKRDEKRNLKRCEEYFDGGLSRKGRRFELHQNGVPLSLKSVLSASQGSVVSQGSSSSGESEFESRLGQGFEGFRNGSHAAMAELQNHRSSSISSSSTVQTQTSPKSNCCAELRNGFGKAETSMMEEMPSVSTRGDGPNGRKVEGFLYRYRRGEEVSIVCVCHGSFLTPAEFVKHAGGDDVAHPLRHIVVNPIPGIFSP